jgi:hypothetical protein
MVRVGLVLLLREREVAGENVPVFDDVIVLVAVPDAVGLLDSGPLRLPVEEAVVVFDCDVEPVEVAVKRMDRDCGAERDTVAEPEEVLEERWEKDCVGLPDEVLERGPLLVGLGEDEDVLERAELVVCVFEAVMLRVAVAVDV